MTKTTKTMTEQETRAWLNSYFFGNTDDFTEIYKGKWTWFYEWNLDTNVEVIEAITYDEEFDDDFFTYTVNFYDSATAGTPYRTGTIKTIRV